MLESRHLLGLFLGVVLLCGVFFALGYVMGRTQYGTPVHAAPSEKSPISSSKSAGIPADAKPFPSSPASSEWDFYTGGKKTDHLEAAANARPKVAVPALALPATARSDNTTLSAARAKSVAATSNALARFRPPRIPRGGVVLQLAALTRESDALALADALQQKRFPSFVVTPTSDNLFRVQLGPYPDLPAAEQARRSLEREGFKTIVKR